MTTTLTCPKCASDMRSYERNRVLVDQCTGCGGLFLDRGELEKLVAAENEWHGGASVPAAAPPPQDRVYQQRYDEPRYDDRGGYHQQSHGHPYGQPYRKKKTSFLSELFDD